MTDLTWEHSQHYSDDWARLKGQCSSCFGIIRDMKPNLQTRREQLGSFERSDDIKREIESNPLE
jgi:hypothetical protein